MSERFFVLNGLPCKVNSQRRGLTILTKPPLRFTSAQFEALNLRAQGLSYTDIAATRGTCRGTIKNLFYFLQQANPGRSLEELTAQAIAVFLIFPHPESQEAIDARFLASINISLTRTNPPESPINTPQPVIFSEQVSL